MKTVVTYNISKLIQKLGFCDDSLFRESDDKVFYYTTKTVSIDGKKIPGKVLIDVNADDALYAPSVEFVKAYIWDKFHDILTVRAGIVNDEIEYTGVVQSIRHTAGGVKSAFEKAIISGEKIKEQCELALLEEYLKRYFKIKK